MLFGERLFLAVIFLVCASSCLAAAFLDVPDDYWAKSEIDQLTWLGALKGYPDGKFRPDTGLNRAELAAILGRLKSLPIPEVTKPPFPDVRPSFWAAGYIAAAAQAGLVAGYPDRTFRPTFPLDRVDAIVTIIRLEGLTEPYDWKVLFRDVTAEHWAVRYVFIAKQKGFLDYVTGNLLEPAKVFSRGELCWMLARTKLVRNARPK